MSGLFGSTTIKGTRITDFAQTSANVGQPIPFLYGRAPVNGNVIFAALPPKETRNVQRQGKGGVKQETFTYSTSYAIAFCRGPILGYWWIKRNGKVVYSQDPNAPIEDQTYAAKWAAKVMMYNGTLDQMPNSTIESYKGSGKVSAFRGLAYIVLPNEDVTENGGAIPSYEAVPIATPTEVWITSKPYAQVAHDEVTTGAGLSAVLLYDILKEGRVQGEESETAFAPTTGQLFEVIPPTSRDWANATFAPTGGKLKFPPEGAFRDSAAPSFAPSTGVLAVPPLGTVKKNDVTATFAPTGGEMVTIVPPSGVAAIHGKLTSYWELTETTGTRYDSKGTNHLTPTAGITSGTGLRGGATVAAKFPGGNADRLGVANNTSLQTPPSGANVMFGWYKRTTPSSYSTLVSKWDATSGSSMERSISMTASQIYATYQRASTYHHTFVPAPSENNWHFFVVWVDPADKKPRVQIDNGEVTVNSLDMSPVTTSTNFALGGTGGPSYAGYFGLNGLMQYCGWIKGDILTEEERTWLYNSGQGRTYAEIVAAAS